MPSSGSSPAEDLFSRDPLTPEEYTALWQNVASPAPDWLTTKVLDPLGAFLAQKIVSFAGSQTFERIFEAITQEKSSAIALLRQIGQRIDAVDASLKAINTQLQGLLQDMDDFRNEMEAAFREGALAKAFAAIDDAQGTAPPSPQSTSGPAPPTFYKLVNTYPATKTPAELKEFRDAFIAAEAERSLTLRIQAIHNALTEPIGQGKPLLVLWPDGLLSKIRQNKMSRDRAYYAFEGWFLQAVSREVSAAVMRCFELADKDRVDWFLQKDFGPKLRRQTGMFLAATERLMLEGIRLPKVPCPLHAEQVAEFPREMESVLLRADLICAALNLVLNQEEAATLRDAVAGIYGRVLARPVDVAAGQPSLALPGYPPSTGIPGSMYEFTTQAAIQLQWDGSVLRLDPPDQSHVYVVRYFWRWPKPLPPQNVALDPRMRGGVKPAYFNVFNNDDWPMAAGFVDFSRILVGAPPGVPNRNVLTTEFRNPPGPNNLQEQPYKAPPLHFLTTPAPGATTLILTYYPGYDFFSKKDYQFYLFNYYGIQPRRLRVTLHISALARYEAMFEKDKRLTYPLAYVNLNVQVGLRRYGEREPAATLYNSDTVDNGSLRLYWYAPGYRKEVEGWYSTDLDIRNDVYLLDLALIYGGNAFVFDAHLKAVQLEFTLKGVYLEWI
jgi:hypothetical protein